jgi:hypothetical protein
MSEPITSPIPPDLRSLLTDLKKEIFYGLNCHQVGVIESFNKGLQTATVQIQVLRNIGNTQVAYPLLTDCPVVFPSGGGAYLSFPVTKGDPCLVLFNDRDLDLWFTTGNVVGPNSARAHSLSDGIVLVGIRNKATPPPTTDFGTVTLGFGASQIQIGPNGTYISLIRSSDGVGSGAIFGDKINFFNASGSLKALMEQLCDTMTAWVNTGGSTPNTATLAAITAVKTKATALLS